MKKILDKLGSFRIYTMTKIRTLVDVYYAFCRRSDTFDNIFDLLKKEKCLYDNIENVGNQKHYHKGFDYGLTNNI